MRPLLAAIAVLLAACGQSADQQLEHARRQLKAGDHRTAVEQARAVLAKDESVLAARLVLAEAQLASGSFDDAVADFERALKGGLPPTQVIPGLAKALSMSGQAVQVITRFGDQSLGEVDAQARLDALLIEAWLATGDLPAAQARATRALQASPQHHAVLIAHARTLIQQGLPQDATKLLDREAGASPDFAEAWALLGELRVRAGQVTEARLAFDKAVQADARNVTAYAGLMELDLASRDQKQAESRWIAMQKALPGHLLTLYYEARLTLLKGDPKRASDLATRMLVKAPSDPRVLMIAGQADLQRGAWLEAARRLGQVLALQPNAVQARMSLAQAQLGMGDATRALSTLKPLIDRPKAPAQAHALSAQALTMLGDPTGARQQFQLAAKADPDNPRYRAAAAVALLDRTNRSSAQRVIADLESAASQDRTIHSDLVLAQTRRALGDTDGALKAIGAAQTKEPRHPGPLLMKAQLLLARRDAAGAREALTAILAIEPTHGEALSMLTQLDVQGGKADDAQARLQRLAQEHPKRFELALALAELQQRLGRPSADVLATLEAATRAARASAEPVLAVIRFHLAQGDAGQALATAQSAAEAFKDQVDVIEALGQCQMAVGQPLQAVRTFRRLASKEPPRPEHLAQLASAHLASDERTAARQRAVQALQVGPGTDQAERVLLELDIAEKRWDSALALARRIQKEGGRRAQGLDWEGDVMLAQRQPQPALGVLRQALSVAPTTDRAIRLHGVMLHLGQLTESDQAANQWMARHPRDVVFLKYLGDQASARGDFAAAEVHFRKVTTLRPRDAVALNNLAYSLLQQRKPGALALAQQANQLAPDQPALMDTLSAAQAAGGDVQGAIKTQERAVNLAPRHGSIRLGMVRLALEAGDKTAAREHLDRARSLQLGSQERAELDRLTAAAR